MILLSYHITIYIRSIIALFFRMFLSDIELRNDSLIYLLLIYQSVDNDKALHRVILIERLWLYNIILRPYRSNLDI